MNLSSSWLGGSVALAFILAVSFHLFEPMVALLSCGLGLALLAVAIIDMQHYIIPDVISLPLIPAGLIATYWLSQNAASEIIFMHISASVLGIAIFVVIRSAYQALRKREGLGLGDAKLAGVAGAWTGLGGLSLVMLGACILALLAVVLTNIHNLRSLQGSMAVPFGTFMAPMIWFVWCWQLMRGGTPVL